MMENDMTKKRCFWCNLKNPVYIAYHDTEWGVFPENEQKLYELFILETFQAGLSWECILNKRENFRNAYDGFNMNKICTYGDKKIEELMKNPGIIRNRRKITASINNTCVYKAITDEFGSFKAYLHSFTGGKVVSEPDVSITTSTLSDVISTDLKKRGMTFVGSTTIYAFLQAVGVINAHSEDCFCYENEMRKHNHRKEVNTDVQSPKKID